MKSAATVLLAVCIALLRTGRGVEGFPLAILEGPTSQVVANGTQATFHCRAKGEELEWVVNGEFATVPRNERLIRQGVILSDPTRIMQGEFSNTIVIPATAHFNGTEVSCLTLNSSTHKRSSDAVLIVAGPPLPPAPRLEVISFSRLELTWSEPFTWQEYPIQEYTIIMRNSSSPTTETVRRTNGQHLWEVSLGTEVARTCSELTFDLTATNGVGRSTPGRIVGGFPLVPTEFQSNPVADVTFQYDGTPVVEITFTPPEMCSFQAGYYSLKIYPSGSSMPLYEQERKRVDNGQKIVEVEITSGFYANSMYRGIVTFQTLSRQIEANFSFDTAFQPTDPVFTNGTESTSPTGDSSTNPTKPIDGKPPNSEAVQDSSEDEKDKKLVVTISVSVGACLAVATIVLLIGIMIVFILKRQLSMKSQAQRENRNCMVDNPLYEGPIYEVISQNKRLKLGSKDKVHAQESLYLDNPTQSLPRDTAPPYDGNGTIINMAGEGKQTSTEIKVEEAEMDGGESSLDHRKWGPKRGYENVALPLGVVEDPYTIMSPVGAMAVNYQVDSGQSNGETSSGRYVMDTSGHVHHHATLV